MNNDLRYVCHQYFIKFSIIVIFLQVQMGGVRTNHHCRFAVVNKQKTINQIVIEDE